MNVNASGFWGTPVARDDQKSVEAHLAMKARMGGGRTEITSLTVQAKEWFQNWATPTAGDSKQSGVSEEAMQRGYSGTPTDHVREWANTFPPPKARDMRGSQGSTSELARHSPDLPTVAVELAVELGLLDARTGEVGGATSLKVDLNPCFVASLMGVPLNWLMPSTSVETDSYLQWLDAHSLSSPIASASTSSRTA